MFLEYLVLVFKTFLKKQSADFNTVRVKNTILSSKAMLLYTNWWCYNPILVICPQWSLWLVTRINQFSLYVRREPQGEQHMTGNTDSKWCVTMLLYYIIYRVFNLYRVFNVFALNKILLMKKLSIA